MFIKDCSDLKVVTMNKLILVASTLGLSLFGASAYGQGTILFNNLGDMNGEVRLFNDSWTVNVPADQDLNFELQVYSPGLEHLLLQRTWLLSDGTAKGIIVSPGRFDDPTHSLMLIPGFAPNTGINVLVTAWTGNYRTLSDAWAAGAAGGLVGFSTDTGSVEAPYPGLQEMPQLNLYPLPEPRTLSLGIIGGVILLIGHRWIRPSMRNSTDPADPSFPVRYFPSRAKG
jgi:hypothetical protein